MKKITLLLVCLLTVCLAKASNGQYEKVMKANLAKMKTAKTVTEMQAVAHQFESIARTEKGKWLPNYYGAFTYVQMARLEEASAKKDQLLDKAEKLLKTAAKLSPKNSEVIALEAYLTLIRISVDSITRGREYSGLVFSKAAEAQDLNPKNPRPHLVLAILKLNMPTMYGGGIVQACPLFKKAAKNFETFEPTNGLMPNWGKARNTQMMKEIGCE
ncbi:MAG TPA: hypothetical protein DCS93_04660 [Microscillaceae bacterium]|nr:hypothetical protein [Microscillaceae bacterium]